MQGPDDPRLQHANIDPGARPDVVASMTDMAAVADGTMGGLFSSHNIEHLYPADVAVAEGKLMEPAYTSPAGPIAPIDIL